MCDGLVGLNVGGRHAENLNGAISIKSPQSHQEMA